MIALDDEQRMVLESVRRIATENFSDNAFTWGRDGNPAVPWENLRLLAEQGFYGINYPEEYGGGGMTEFEVALVVEAVGRVCPDTARLVKSQGMVAPRAIEMFGSEPVKERYLPPVMAGESLIAIAISEPHAGSDVQSMNTHVEEASDGELYLNGEKTWVSNFPYADAAVVWTRFPEGELGSVVIDLDDPGIEVVNNYTNMAEQVQTHFFIEDVHVPAENVLVRGRESLKNSLRHLNWERCGSAIEANSLAICAFEQALDYAQEREQFGQPLVDFQGIRWKLADMAKRIEASRTLVYRAALNAQTRGRVPDRLETSIAKLYSNEMVNYVVDEALQIHGAIGYMREQPIEYLYRLARARRIAAGTDEVLKNGIADVVVDDGLPDFMG